jgi:hypothetical protein
MVVHLNVVENFLPDFPHQEERNMENTKELVLESMLS